MIEFSRALKYTAKFIRPLRGSSNLRSPSFISVFEQRFMLQVFVHHVPHYVIKSDVVFLYAVNARSGNREAIIEHPASLQFFHPAAIVSGKAYCDELRPARGVESMNQILGVPARRNPDQNIPLASERDYLPGENIGKSHVI